MADIFEKESQHDFFELPERPEDYKPPMPDAPKFKLPESVDEYDNPAKKGITDDEFSELMKGWISDVQQKTKFENNAAESTGVEFSSLEYDELYKLRKKGILNDDDIYKLAFSKELGDYLGLDVASVFKNYDNMWRLVSEDWESRYALPKSRYEAVRDSVQVAKNMMPLGVMGIKLQNLHNRIRYANNNGAGEKELMALNLEAGKLWSEITAIKSANDELSKRMPKDALTTIITGTIQSAPLDGQVIAWRRR